MRRHEIEVLHLSRIQTEGQEAHAPCPGREVDPCEQLPSMKTLRFWVFVQAYINEFKQSHCRPPNRKPANYIHWPVHAKLYP